MADTRATAASVPEGALAQPLRRTSEQRRRPTARAHHRGPTDGHERDVGARPRGLYSVSPRTDMRAMAAQEPEGASAAHQVDTCATAVPDPEGATARHPRLTRERWRRPTPRAS